MTGLSIDMVMGNVVGFLYLSVYTSFFYWDPYTRKQYRERNGSGADNMVQLNDVAFAIHAFLISLFTYGQILAYRKPTEKMSRTAKVIATLIGLITAISLGLWLSDIILWLDFLYALSYLKIVITIMKYIPQASLLNPIEIPCIMPITCMLTHSLALSFFPVLYHIGILELY